MIDQYKHQREKERGNTCVSVHCWAKRRHALWGRPESWTASNLLAS